MSDPSIKKRNKKRKRKGKGSASEAGGAVLTDEAQGIGHDKMPKVGGGIMSLIILYKLPNWKN